MGYRGSECKDSKASSDSNDISGASLFVCQNIDSSDSCGISDVSDSRDNSDSRDRCERSNISVKSHYSSGSI